MTAVPETVTHEVVVHPDVDTVVLTPYGDMTDELTDRIGKSLTAAATHHTHLIVDLHAVHTMQPAALSMLVRARQRTKAGGGLFCLVAPSRFVLTVLHTMRLVTAMPAYPDLREAMDAIRSGHRPAPQQNGTR
jgi:anti-sigma B factor antagonist